ncbi:MAG: hypothetical protein GY898_08625 [Proteobacteria bacterium]|nr:hypothetical protein [Pseudomonadota bacterium]
MSDFSLGDELEIVGTMQPGTVLRVQYGGLDLAGNFSGWSDERRITLPAAGCSAEGGVPLGLLPLLLLGVPGWRRNARGVGP